jgi:hypothetical protein
MVSPWRIALPQLYSAIERERQQQQLGPPFP